MEAIEIRVSRLPILIVNSEALNGRSRFPGKFATGEFGGLVGIAKVAGEELVNAGLREIGVFPGSEAELAGVGCEGGSKGDVSAAASVIGAEGAEESAPSVVRRKVFQVGGEAERFIGAGEGSRDGEGE